MSDCPICLSDVAVDPVTCPSCSKSVCNTCFENHLLSLAEDVAICHSCAKPWSEDFVDENTYDEFRNGALRAHRTKILVDQEAARLPALQDRARRYAIAQGAPKRARPWYVRNMIDSYGAPITDMSRQHNDLCFYCNHDVRCTGGPLAATVNRCRQCHSHREDIENCSSLRDAIHDAQVREAIDELYGPGWCRTGAPPPPRRVFRACPLADCRGFLDEVGKCGMCNKQVCLKCHEVLPSFAGSSHLSGSASHDVLGAANHECDPATAATVKLLARETKPCPTCHASIYKIDGCDQMWCTQCQTPFSWATGQKEAGRVHNPHYYEWMRRTRGSVPREPECRDGQLRELMHVESVSQLIYHLMVGLHRRIAEQLQYNRPPLQNEEALSQISIRYLAGQIDKTEWARRIYIEKRKQKRLQAQHDIVHAFTSAATDLMNAIDVADVKPTLRAIADLMVYMEEALDNMYARYFYKGAGVHIVPDWSLITTLRASALTTICGTEINRNTDINPQTFMRYVNHVLSA